MGVRLWCFAENGPRAGAWQRVFRPRVERLCVPSGTGGGRTEAGGWTDGDRICGCGICWRR